MFYWDYAFINCSFTGRLILPDCLEYIGDHAFDSAGNFVGDLVIPEKIIKLENNVFPQTTFSGNLILNNVIELSQDVFRSSKFSGELIIPEGIITIPSYCFVGCSFRSVHFPHQISNYSSTHSEDDSISQLWVVSSCDSYSEIAEELAAEKNVRLIDGKEFASLLLEVGIKGLSL